MFPGLKINVFHLPQGWFFALIFPVKAVPAARIMVLETPPNVWMQKTAIASWKS
jgi:hypothetical protein